MMPRGPDSPSWKIAMSPFINTAWPRFFTVALPIALLAVFLSSSIDASPNGWLMQATLLLTPFSFCCSSVWVGSACARHTLNTRS